MQVGHPRLGAASAPGTAARPMRDDDDRSVRTPPGAPVLLYYSPRLPTSESRAVRPDLLFVRRVHGGIRDGNGIRGRAWGGSFLRDHGARPASRASVATAASGVRTDGRCTRVRCGAASGFSRRALRDSGAQCGTLQEWVRVRWISWRFQRDFGALDWPPASGLLFLFIGLSLAVERE